VKRFLQQFLLCLSICILLFLSACNRGRGRVLEVAYVSGVQATLRDHVAAVYEKAGVVKNGERVEVLDHDRRFVKVRTADGTTGWMEQRYLVSQEVFDQIQKLTADNFTKQTGIKVTYTEAINDNEEFFGKIQPDLEAGNQTAYDLIVMTDWMIQKMIRFGYLEKIDKSQVPNFTANADSLYVNPWYDPNNVHSLAWQSGITGIGYNPKLTKREITTFDDLLDPAFKGHVGLFSEMRDTMCMALLSIDVKPEEATVADVQKAGDKLLKAAKTGQFRSFYGNDYYDELANKNLWITIAWSGDITQMQLYDNPNVKFIVPQSGGMRWVDNMAIPNKAAHPVDAHMMMNFWYDPANAVPLSEYIGYFSPVKGVPDLISKDADAAEAKGDKATAAQLRVVAKTVNPTPDELQNVYNYKRLTEAEELAWNSVFEQVRTG